MARAGAGRPVLSGCGCCRHLSAPVSLVLGDVTPRAVSGRVLQEKATRLGGERGRKG